MTIRFFSSIRDPSNLEPTFTAVNGRLQGEIKLILDLIGFVIIE